jgi:tetratricopeptide (TPR) repeat protein
MTNSYNKRLYTKSSATVLAAAMCLGSCLGSFGSAGIVVADPVLPKVFAPRTAIDIRMGRNEKSGRIEIYGSIGSRASVRRDEDRVIVRLPGTSAPDIGDLAANPPMGVKAIEVKSDARAYELWVTLTDKTRAHFGRSDGGVYIQFEPDLGEDSSNVQSLKATLNGPDVRATLAALTKPLAPTPKPTPAHTPATTSENPLTTAINKTNKIPVVPLSLKVKDGVSQVSFAFPRQAGAAVFARADAIWIVFDQEVDLRLPPNLYNKTLIDKAVWVRSEGATALRLKAPSVLSFSAMAEDLTWRIDLKNTAEADTGSGENAPIELDVSRDNSSGSQALSINMAGASKLVFVRDPEVGDKIAVVTARGPVKRLAKARDFLQFSLASTAQGLALTRLSPDLKVDIFGDMVQMGRKGGLTLSPSSSWDQNKALVKLDYVAGPYPSVMNQASWQTLPSEGFLNTYNRLQEAAAKEQETGETGPNQARLALARFLVGQDMGYEAQGALDLLLRQNPRSANDPQVRGLRLMAKVMTGRFKSAQADLDSTALISDPSAQIWRGYMAAREGQYAEARKAFAAGSISLNSFSPVWRLRFAAANAKSALALGDLAAARATIGYAMAQTVAPLEKLEALLVAGKILEAMDKKQQALGVFQEIAKASLGRISMPARLEAARLKLELGISTTPQAIGELESLRFAWRGDPTELELIGTMGDIYINAGRYREALNVLKSGGRKFFDRPEATQLGTKLNAAFRGLFLDGMADGLQPIEALGLFYDFQDLTPVGSDGDDMVRKLARRLVDVDLLDQAAGLLQYQIENRLEGVAKSSVAADLAAIQLMNRQPEKALQALWKTRTTLLPKALQTERRIYEARALIEVGDIDHAIEILGNDVSPQALDVRTEIFWRQKDWARAALTLERQLGDTYKGQVLSLEDEARLIRAGVAYSLASDQTGLDRLSQRFAKFIAGAQSPDALRVALAGMDNGPLSAQDFALAAAQASSFNGWVAAMKKRLRDKTVPLPPKGRKV